MRDRLAASLTPRCRSCVSLREMDMRLKLLEAEMRGQVDLSEFAQPEVLKEMMKHDDPA